MSGKVYDVAKKCNVSPSTVSKVFQGKGSLTEETRIKVLKVAEELGYKPRKYSIRKSFVESVLLTVPDLHYSDFANSHFYGHVINGIERALADNGFQLRLMTVPSDQNDFRQVKSFLDESVKGVLLLGSGVPRTTVLDFKQRGLPIVSINYNRLADGINSVVNDNLLGAQQIVEYLIKLGHRDIAYIGGSLDNLNMEQRFMGYRKALEQGGFQEVGDFIRFCGFHSTLEQGSAAADDILGKQKPTAIFAASDSIAMGAMKVIRELALQVPGDISVVGFNDIDLTQLVTPQLTTVRVHRQKMGEYAVSHLIQLIKNKSTFTIPIKIELPTELVLRESAASK